MSNDRIITHCICPPIPMRQFDWMAYREDREESGPHGYGCTETEAIVDLIELEEELRVEREAW